MLRRLNPTPPVGGLSIGDGVLRFLAIKDRATVVTASLRLPPGIVVGGIVADPQGLRAALSQLHGQVSRPTELVHVVLLLPPGLAHAQVFSVPALPERRLEEAARLNLQMISPIEFSTAYAGWERIGKQTSGTGQLDLLGAFAEAAAVDACTAAATDAGFSAVAVEFNSLSLTRLLQRSAAAVGGGEAHLCIEVGEGGITLMVLRNLDLYFSHFHSWAAIREEMGLRDASRDNLLAFLVKEVRKLLNFYASKWGGSVAGVILFAPGLRAEITGALEQAFSLPVKPLVLKDFPNLDPLWLPTLGAALRGAYPRSADRFISLTNAPVQVQYARARLLAFISLWSKLAAVTAAVMVVVTVGVDSMVAHVAAGARSQLVTLPAEQLAEVAKLEASARAFNAGAASLKTAAAKAGRAGSFLQALTALAAAKQVQIVSVSVAGTDVSLAGVASSETALFAFRDALVKTAGVSGVDVPLDAIRYRADGSAEFTIEATRTKW